MIRYSFIRCLLLTLIAGATALAQDVPAFDYIRLPVGARTAALGNSTVAGSNDPTMLFINPGAMASVTGMQGSAGFFKHILDVNAGYVAFSRQVDSVGTFAAGIMYMNWGSMDRTDNLGNRNGTFGAGDLAIIAGYGNSWENLQYGASLKFLYSTIDEYSATGIALDAGVVWLIPQENLSLALSVLNAGTQLSAFGAEKDDMPLDVKLGVSKKLAHLPLTLYLAFHKLTEARDNLIDHLSSFSLGAEITFSQYFRGRVGFNNETRKEMKVGSSAGLAGFNLGFGINLKKYTIDYGFSSWGEVGDLHRIGVNLLL